MRRGGKRAVEARRKRALPRLEHAYERAFKRAAHGDEGLPSLDGIERLGAAIKNTRRALGIEPKPEIALTRR